MELYYNVRADKRRQLAHTIAEHLGEECIYHGTPNFEYTIGEFTLDCVGALSYSENVSTDKVEKLKKYLMGKGFEPSNTKMQVSTDKLIQDYERQNNTAGRSSNSSPSAMDGCCNTCSTCWHEYIHCCDNLEGAGTDGQFECCNYACCLGCMSM